MTKIGNESTLDCYIKKPFRLELLADQDDGVVRKKFPELFDAEEFSGEIRLRTPTQLHN